MKKTNRFKTRLSEKEQDAAAKYMSLSNLDLLHFLGRCNNNIHAAYSLANESLLAETGCSAQEEYDYWSKEIKRDQYTNDEWDKVKGGIVC